MQATIQYPYPILCSDTDYNPKHKKLMKVIDKINISNPNSARLVGMDKKIFKIKQKYLSSAFPTNINDVLRVVIQ